MKRLFLILCSFVFIAVFLSSLSFAESSCNDHNYFPTIADDVYLEQISVSAAGHLCRRYAYWYCLNGNHTDYLPLNDPLFPDTLYPHTYTVQSVDLGHVGTDMHAYVYVCSRSFSGQSCNYTQVIQIPCTDDCIHYVNRKFPNLVTE